jgi:hypothetical protein
MQSLTDRHEAASASGNLVYSRDGNLDIRREDCDEAPADLGDVLRDVSLRPGVATPLVQAVVVVKPVLAFAGHQIHGIAEHGDADRDVLEAGLMAGSFQGCLHAFLPPRDLHENLLECPGHWGTLGFLIRGSRDFRCSSGGAVLLKTPSRAPPIRRTAF